MTDETEHQKAAYPQCAVPALCMALYEDWRSVPALSGADLSGKLLHIMEGVTAAFESPMPSLNGQDFLIGVAGAVIMRLAVYLKGKNAKKYRKLLWYEDKKFRVTIECDPDTGRFSAKREDF